VDKELLTQLDELGLLPGSEVRLEDQGVDKFLIAKGQDEGLLVESDISRHIFLSTTV
jgi:FeoA domain.